MSKLLTRLGWLLLSIAFAGSTVVAHAADKPAAVQAPVALITGSDRGIGLALTKEFTARGWRVVATCRTPERATELNAFAAEHKGVTVERLDVADNAAIDALSARLRDQPIDALVNNAGVLGDVDAQALALLDPAEFERVLRINTYAPLRLSQAFLPQVLASRQKKIVSISSGLGSLALAPDSMTDVTHYYYAISKAGLNMGMRMLATELGPKGVRVGIVSPGPVATDMQAAVRAAAAKRGNPITAPTLAPADSARALVNFVESLDEGKSGRFFSYSGREIPW